MAGHVSWLSLYQSNDPATIGVITGKKINAPVAGLGSIILGDQLCNYN